MLNYLWLALLLGAVVIGGLNGQLKEVSDAAFDTAKSAVMSIALPLVGITALWLGLMRLAEKAGLIQTLALLLRPVMRRLFPEVPSDHPAMGSMLMNMAANMIGLTNAATPLGLRAMTDLEKLNPHPGTATNAMCTFLAINTSSLQLVPTTAISIMAAAGASNPTAIVGTTLLATCCSLSVGILSVKTLQRLPMFRLPALPQPGPTPTVRSASSAPPALPTETDGRGVAQTPRAPTRTAIVTTCLLFLFFAALFAAQIRHPAASAEDANGFLRVINALAVLAIPFFLSFFPLYAAAQGVRVYEEFVEGAKEGFTIAVRIIPFLVAMLVAVGTFRAAGGVKLFTNVLAPVLHLLRFPSELLPMALTRPLSGSATIGLFADLVNALGPDALITRMGGTLLGSTETTFYVLAVYFGAVAVKRTRHALAAGLLADAAGIIASVTICRLVFAQM